jgi:hypothetical protein
VPIDPQGDALCVALMFSLIMSVPVARHGWVLGRAAIQGISGLRVKHDAVGNLVLLGRGGQASNHVLHKMSSGCARSSIVVNFDAITSGVGELKRDWGFL